MPQSAVPQPRRRWRRWLLIVYVVLLVASFLVQTVLPGSRRTTALAVTAADATLYMLDLPVMTADGAQADSAPLSFRLLNPGASHTVILLHGNPGSLDDLTGLGQRLAATGDYAVLIPDLPGFGHSDAAYYPDYGCRAQARTVLALMDALQIQQAAVFGHSMAGGTILEMIDIAPARVNSVVFYGAIGIQEGEGSGDYTMEHIKYATGMVLLNALPEFIPHFGKLGDRRHRWAVVRTFWDTDQRPYREILTRMRQPLLILQGRDDFLVYPWVAEAHHELVPHSELVMMDDSHFMIFTPEGIDRLESEMRHFLRNHLIDGQPGHAHELYDITPGSVEASEQPPVAIEGIAQGKPWRAIGALVVATFGSEDLTCITAGMLIRQGRLDYFVGILGCTLGIFVGDLGLYLLGFLAAGPLARSRWGRRWNDSNMRQRAHDWFNHHGWQAIVISRFVPGTRFVTYLGAGLLRTQMSTFIVWAFLASLVWTPLLVILSAVLGGAILTPFEKVFGHGWWSVIAAVVVLFVFVKIIIAGSGANGRQRLIASLQKLWRWEFWPAWLFYLPLYLYLPLLALRHRSLLPITACNPGLPDDSLVGESKAGILNLLPADAVIPWAFIPAAPSAAEPEVERRLAALDAAMQSQGWTYPVILKPNASQRGCGLKRARDREAARTYFGTVTTDVIAQRYHPGPYECGIFYMREVGAAHGRIFSVTDKAFAQVTGDGVTTLRDLIWQHPRYRMQGDLFLARLGDAAERIPAEGEVVPLGVAGNHCQGTLFRDGAHLITPELEARVDAICGSIAGFHFGRLDVRYSDPAAFKRGEDLHIVELNGCAAESTNLYDPDKSLIAAWGILLRQWTAAYRIGAANRDRGHRPSSPADLLRGIRRHYRDRQYGTVSD